MTNPSPTRLTRCHAIIPLENPRPSQLSLRTSLCRTLYEHHHHISPSCNKCGSTSLKICLPASTSHDRLTQHNKQNLVLCNYSIKVKHQRRRNVKCQLSPLGIWSHLCQVSSAFWTYKPARLIIRLFFGFASDSVIGKLNQSTNSDTAMLSCLVFFKIILCQSSAMLL